MIYILYYCLLYSVHYVNCHISHIYFCCCLTVAQLLPTVAMVTTCLHIRSTPMIKTILKVKDNITEGQGHSGAAN